MKRFLATLFCFSMLINSFILNAVATGPSGENETNSQAEEYIDTLQVEERRGDFQVFDGTLDSSSDVKTYHITVDYTTESEYCLGILRTGKSGLDVTILDSDGIECATQHCDGPGSSQGIQRVISLKKPDGATGDYTYTVQVSSSDSTFVAENGNFRIAYGPASQKYYFFEGVTNSVDLPYYHSVRNTDQIEADYSSTGPLSEIGNYYKIEGRGTETVTLYTTDKECRFRILDGETLTPLYDCVDEVPNQYGNNNIYSIRVDFDFALGETYYVVVYTPKGISNRTIYNITVGEPKLVAGSLRLELPSKHFVKGETYEWTFNLTTPTSGLGYVESFTYNGSSAGWPYEGGHFYITPPGKTTWLSNVLYNSSIKFNFDDINVPLVRADGQWKLRIIAGKTGTYPGSTVRLAYWYEL